MNNLLTSLMTKFTGSTFSSDVGGRIYLDQAPDGCELPYCVFFIVSRIPNNVFTKKGQNVQIQFSLFSASTGATEITTMYSDLRTLLDETSLVITDADLIIMKERNLTTMVNEITATDATQSVRHWAVDYEIITQNSTTVI